METMDILWMLLALTAGTQLCRFIPMVLPKSVLAHPILQKLNKMLPLAIMILLVLTSINLPKADQGYALFTAQVIALCSVVLSYAWLKNILLSVSLGILNLNLLLWLFAHL